MENAVSLVSSRRMRGPASNAGHRIQQFTTKKVANLARETKVPEILWLVSRFCPSCFIGRSSGKLQVIGPCREGRGEAAMEINRRQDRWAEFYPPGNI
jgi:hypothetical protein